MEKYGKDGIDLLERMNQQEMMNGGQSSLGVGAGGFGAPSDSSQSRLTNLGLDKPVGPVGSNGPAGPVGPIGPVGSDGSDAPDEPHKPDKPDSLDDSDFPDGPYNSDYPDSSDYADIDLSPAAKSSKPLFTDL